MIRSQGSRVGAVLCVSLLAACSSEAIVAKVAPPEVDKYARAYFETLRAGSPEDVARELSAEIAQNPAMLDSVQSMRRQFAAFGVIDSAHIVNGDVNLAQGSAPTRRAIIYEAWAHGAVALMHIEIVEDGTHRSVNGLQIQRIAQPLEAVNGFRDNMGFAELLVLIVAGGITLFDIATAVVVAMTPMKRRWLWALFALIGFGSVTMNWTTGTVTSQLLSVQFLGAIRRFGLAGPWFISVSFPLGAILALRKRHQTLAQTATPAPTVPPVEATVVNADESV
jgi:hypothetical protein